MIPIPSLKFPSPSRSASAMSNYSDFGPSYNPLLQGITIKARLSDQYIYQDARKTPKLGMNPLPRRVQLQLLARISRDLSIEIISISNSKDVAPCVDSVGSSGHLARTGWRWFTWQCVTGRVHRAASIVARDQVVACPGPHGCSLVLGSHTVCVLTTPRMTADKPHSRNSPIIISD